MTLTSKLPINNKWIATISSGLFYFSSDGQETIFHLTKDNSPLPSNNVIDVSLDTANGTVYIATDKGLVAFKAGGSNTQENFEKNLEILARCSIRSQLIQG